MPHHAQRRPTEPAPPSRQLTVREVMTNKVITVRADAPVSEAVILLADGHVSGLAVLNGHDKLIGVITSLDILTAEAETDDAETRSRMLQTTTVEDLMSSPPRTVGPDLEVRQAALEMEYGDVHRLFVVADEKVIGVISRSDVNRAFAQARG